MSSRDSEGHVAALLRSLGADPSSNPRLAETPLIVAGFLAAYVEPRDPPALRGFPFDGESVVRLAGLRFYSLCEHHLLPFFGTVDIAYIPHRIVAGFGGIQRVVSHFAQRLQLQERMTGQIADHLERHLAPRGLSVLSTARQMCLEMTGGSPETIVTASVHRGALTP